MSNIQYHSQRVDTLKDFLSPRRPQRYGSRSSAEGHAIAQSERRRTHCLDGVSVGDPGVTRRNHILNYKAAEATFTSYEDFISLRPQASPRLRRARLGTRRSVDCPRFLLRQGFVGLRRTRQSPISGGDGIFYLLMIVRISSNE